MKPTQTTGGSGTTQKLDPLDQKILELIEQQKNQTEIAKLCGKNQSTISRRIERLLDLGILGDRKTNPRYYTVTKSLGSAPAQIDAVEKHHIQVKCAIKSPGNIHNAHRQTRANLAKKTALKHWAAYWIQENNVKIQITTKSIIFWITGAGRTDEECVKNSKDHAAQVRTHVEQTYNCLLGDPEFKDETGYQESHYLPMELTEKDLQDLEGLWTDDSHKNCVETAGQKQVRELLGLKKDVQDLKFKQNDTSAEFAIIHRDISNLANNISNLTNSVMQLVNAMSGQTQNAGIAPRPPPNNYI